MRIHNTLSKAYQKLPDVLKKQAVLHGWISLFFLIAGITLWAIGRNFYFAVPFLCASVFLIANELVIAYHCLSNNCLQIEGICKEIEISGLRKRVKAISIDVNGKTLYIPIYKRIIKLKTGDTIRVYLNAKMPLYEKDGTYIAYHSYALERKADTP